MQHAEWESPVCLLTANVHMAFGHPAGTGVETCSMQMCQTQS